MLPPASQQTLVLIPSATEIYIDAVSPLLVTVNPVSSLSLQNEYANAKPYQIEYIFNDGHKPIIQKLFASPNKQDFNLSWKLEPGDPRNYPVEHLFSLSSAVSSYIKYSVKVSWIEDPLDAVGSITYNIHLNLTPPSLADSKYFKEIHLVSTRMFGPKDTLLYNFEGVEPFFSLPVLVDWGIPTRPPALPARFNKGIASAQEIEESLEYRPVKILPPFYQKIYE